MLKPVAAVLTAFCAAILCAAPFSVRVSPEASVSLSLDTAAARIGRPLTPMSIAGVHRRAMRRAYYGYGAYGLYGYGSGTNWPSSYYASTYGTYWPSSYFGSAYGSYRPSSYYGTHTIYRPSSYYASAYGSYRPSSYYGYQSRAYYRPYRSLYAYAPYYRRSYSY